MCAAQLLDLFDSRFQFGNDLLALLVLFLDLGHRFVTLDQYGKKQFGRDIAVRTQLYFVITDASDGLS